MAKFTCKYCEAKTDSPNRVCYSCQEKLVLIRQIKEMLMPTYLEREKKNGNQR